MKRVALLAAAAMLGIGAPAMATDYVYTQYFKVTYHQHGSTGYVTIAGLAPSPTIDLQEVDLTLSADISGTLPYVGTSPAVGLGPIFLNNSTGQYIGFNGGPLAIDTPPTYSCGTSSCFVYASGMTTYKLTGVDAAQFYGTDGIKVDIAGDIQGADPSTIGIDFSGSVSYAYNIIYPAVPEPASWAMMLIGFGAIGVAMRGRRSVRVAKGSVA